MSDREQSEYEAQERERIGKLTREDLVREYLDGMALNELFAVAYDYIYADDCAIDNDWLREELLSDI